MMNKKIKALLSGLILSTALVACGKSESANVKEAVKADNYEYVMKISEGSSEVSVTGQRSGDVSFVEIKTSAEAEGLKEYYGKRNDGFRYYFGAVNNWSEGANITQYSYKQVAANAHIDPLVVLQGKVDDAGKLTTEGETALKAWAPTVFANMRFNLLVETIDSFENFKVNASGKNISGLSFTAKSGSKNFTISVTYSNVGKVESITVPAVITPYEG